MEISESYILYEYYIIRVIFRKGEDAIGEI